MHEFKHPKYYTELRKRNKEEARAQLKVPSSNLDQAISDEASTEATSVRPGPGLSGKQQAIEETVPHIDIQEAASTSKPQATSKGKRQATSKRQASE